MRVYVALEVKVGEVIRFFKFEEFRESGISIDFVNVFRILKFVRTDVGVDCMGNFFSSHFRAKRFVEEGGESIADGERYVCRRSLRG